MEGTLPAQGVNTPKSLSGACAEKDQMDRSEEEEVLLDENRKAEKHEFYMTGALAVSPDNEMLAWAEDTTGDEMFTLHIKNIASGQSLLDTPIEVSSRKHASQCHSASWCLCSLHALQTMRSLCVRSVGEGRRA